MQEVCIACTRDGSSSPALQLFAQANPNYHIAVYASELGGLGKQLSSTKYSSVLVDISSAADLLQEVLRAHGGSVKILLISSDGSASQANAVEPHDSEDGILPNTGAVTDKNAIYLRFDSKIHRIPLEDLFYVEAQKDYVILHTRTQEFRVLSSMKFMTAELGDVDFHRSHRSFIVRLDKISHLEGEYFHLKDNAGKVPLGPSFRGPFLKSVRMI